MCSAVQEAAEGELQYRAQPGATMERETGELPYKSEQMSPKITLSQRASSYATRRYSYSIISNSGLVVNLFYVLFLFFLFILR